jgi:hypothetical protein
VIVFENLYFEKVKQHRVDPNSISVNNEKVPLYSPDLLPFSVEYLFMLQFQSSYGISPAPNGAIQASDSAINPCANSTLG